MLEVLGRATSGNVQKVLFLLEELGAPYKRHDYGKTFEGTTLTPQYQAINPTQKVPTLRDGELHVWESHTILRYVANKQEAHALYPRDPAARSQVERWMDWTLASLNVAYLAGFKEAKLPPEQLSEAAAAAVRRAVAAGRAPGGPALGRGRGLLPGRHLPGAAGAPLPEIPHPKPELEHLRQWMARIEQRPAFAAAVAAG